MKFAIQTNIKNEPIHDFSFHLMKAIEFQEWQDNLDFEYMKIGFKDLFNLNPYGIVPVGSIEFVNTFLSHFYHKRAQPKNVPDILFQFAHRNIFNGSKNVITRNDFVKSNIHYKSEYNGLVTDSSILMLPPGNYQVSEYVDFKSEWRAFVFKNKLVGLQNYLGDFTEMPDIDEIYEMIEVYKPEAPAAYTLDVGIIEGNNKTSIVEVHDFFSVGLYGFSEYNILPAMFSQWFFEFIR